MGKKKNNKGNKNTTNINSNDSQKIEYPFVSICTPTFNRRPFIPSMIECFKHQNYPKDRMEWIIIDDGTDKIEDLIKDIPQIKYFKYDEKMVLGKKRNLLHEKSKGDILVYMDDDDYYPPMRVSHAVNMLQTHPKALCAGSSEIYIYFKHIQKMVQFGPYGASHATAGTFAFRRELLKDNAYDDNAALAEEKSFLKNYTVPFVQLEPKKTILVFSHEHNTFDKKTLLENAHPRFVRETDKKVEDFIKEENLKDFYMNKIEGLLENYDPGKPEMKPDVLKQIKEINIEREKMKKEMMEKQMRENQNHNNSNNEESKIMADINGQKTVLKNEQIVGILQQQQMELQKKREEIESKDKKIKELEIKLENLMKIINS